jgi:hypothetical protein
VRDRALDTKTLVNLRSHATSVAMYTMDYRDSLIVLGQPGQGFWVYDRGSQRYSPNYFTACTAWKMLLDDLYYDGDPTSDVFYPADGLTRLGSGNVLPFQMTCTIFAQPEFWNLFTRIGPEQLGQTFMHQVAFPSQKIMMYTRWEIEPDQAVTLVGPDIQVIHNRFDGSASVRKSHEVRPGVSTGEGVYPPATLHMFDEHTAGMHTVDGLRGVDLSL